MPVNETLQRSLRRPNYTFARATSVLREYASDVLPEKWTRSDQGVVNQREHLVLGLRRSGNHAVIHWIEEQAEGPGLHLNNILPHDNPYRYAYKVLSGEWQTENDWLREELARYRWYFDGDDLSLIARDATGCFVNKGYLIHSYEDLEARQIGKVLRPQRRQRFFGLSKIQRDILVLRDPFNLMASRFRTNRKIVKSKNKTILDVWLEHAREYLGEQNALKDKVVINYNRWATDREYRRYIAQALDLSFTDAGVNFVPSIGGGSSFDRRSFTGQANLMDLFGRWKHFENDPEFIRSFRRPEVFAYAKKIFGEIDGVNRLEARVRSAG